MGLGLACPMEEVSGSGPMGQAGRQLFCSVLSVGGLPPAGSEPRGRKAAATIGEAAVAVDAYLGSGPARGRISRHLAAVRDPGPLLNVERSARNSREGPATVRVVNALRLLRQGAPSGAPPTPPAEELSQAKKVSRQVAQEEQEASGKRIIRGRCARVRSACAPTHSHIFTPMRAQVTRWRAGMASSTLTA